MRTGNEPKPTGSNDLEELMRRPRVLATIGIRDRTSERMLAAGTLARPDLRIGRLTLWRPSTFKTWIDTKCDCQRREVA